MMTTNAEAVQRLRITFSQTGALRYVGHLDMVRTWERGLRRAGIPLAYSGGFHPGPRFYFASGLPLGATGRAEIVDVLLTGAMAPEAFLAAVGPHLPVGLALIRAEEAPLKTPALQGLLRAGVWQVDVQSDEAPAELSGRVDALLAGEAALTSKRRKGRQVEYDLRPLVLAITYQGQPEPGWHRLSMALRSEPSATGRADAVLAALGLVEAVARIERVQLIFASADSLDERPATE
jgi:radical SAM-linked protein